MKLLINKGKIFNEATMENDGYIENEGEINNNVNGKIMNFGIMDNKYWKVRLEKEINQKRQEIEEEKKEGWGVGQLETELEELIKKKSELEGNENNSDPAKINNKGEIKNEGSIG